MIDENSYTRIIGDFLEVNADIAKDQFYSKYPNFIAKFIAKLQRKKLLRSVHKLRKSNIVLDYNNLYEFFILLYTNYPPEGTFGDVVKVLYSEEKGILEGVLKFDNYSVLISLDDHSNGFFDLKAKKTENGISTGLDLSSRQLSTKKKEYEDIYNTVNKQILENMCDYITTVIENFIKENR